MHHHRNHPRCEYFQSLLEISCKRLQEKNGSWSSSCIWGCHWVLHQHHRVDIWIKMRWIYHLHSQPLRPALHLTPFHILASHEFHFLDFIFLANILYLKHLGWPGLSAICWFANAFSLSNTVSSYSKAKILFPLNVHSAGLLHWFSNTVFIHHRDAVRQVNISPDWYNSWSHH